MQVESYLVEEINASDASVMAADATAIELINKLNLDGQAKLVVVETHVRQCFQRMTLLEFNVFSELFPTIHRVEKFDTEAIPLRVLELLERAKQCSQFVAYEVWSSRTRKDDPILVALTGKLSPQAWNPDYVTVEGRYLIARWGKALDSFNNLLHEAAACWKTKERFKLRKEIHEMQGRLERLDDEAETRFSAGGAE